MNLARHLLGIKGASGFGSSSTAEEVSEGVDLSGAVAIVTGGASGIGQETARVLALRGADVILAVRNVEAGEVARQAILTKQPAAKVQVLKLDLSSKASVRQFVDDFHAANLPLHILVNNAGVMGCPFMLTADGHEMQFGTNHLGHFLLVKLLLDDLKKGAKSRGKNSRIVNVSSYAHTIPYKEGIRFDKLDSPEGYQPWLAYGQSKLANILHARQLARQLIEEGAPVTVNALHPGAIRTPLQRHMNGALIGVLYWATWKGWKTIPQGAATSVYLACSPHAEDISGEYFQDVNIEAGRAYSSAYSKDMEMAKRLWEVSEELTK